MWRQCCGNGWQNCFATYCDKWSPMFGWQIANQISLHNTGSILLWTTRQCATYSKNWRFVTRLRETNVDISVLDMITKGTRSTLHWTNHQWRWGIRSRETNVDRSVLDIITKGTRSTLHWTNHQWRCGIRSRVTSSVFMQYRYEHSLANL